MVQIVALQLNVQPVQLNGLDLERGNIQCQTVVGPSAGATPPLQPNNSSTFSCERLDSFPNLQPDPNSLIYQPTKPPNHPTNSNQSKQLTSTQSGHESPSCSLISRIAYGNATDVLPPVPPPALPVVLPLVLPEAEVRVTAQGQPGEGRSRESVIWVSREMRTALVSERWNAARR